MSGLQLQLRLEIHIRVNKFRGAVYVDEKRFSSDGKAYAILQACDAEGLVPTWKDYNSKLCPKGSIRTTYAELPILKTPPTDWSTL